jgi:hypothetical protein
MGWLAGLAQQTRLTSVTAKTGRASATVAAQLL